MQVTLKGAKKLQKQNKKHSNVLKSIIKQKNAGKEYFGTGRFSHLRVCGNKEIVS